MKKNLPPNNIKILRKELDWSQSRLAHAIGVTTATIEKLENSKMELTHSYTLKLAHAMRKHPSEILKIDAQDIEVRLIGSDLRHYTTEQDIPTQSNATIKAASSKLERVTVLNPIMTNMEAVKIEDASMEPFLFRGDIGFYKERSTNYLDFIHKPALVWTVDNLFALKIIRPSIQVGYFDLDSYNSGMIKGVQLAGVAKIHYIQSN